MSLKGLFIVAFLLFMGTTVYSQINCPSSLPLTLVGNTDYCIGSSGASLSISETYDGYEWLPTSETNQNAVLTAGNYQVVVTHYTGCTDTLAFVVTQVSNPPQPTIDTSGPTHFCYGESVVLSVPTWYPYYEWSTGSVGDEITVFDGGTFNVSVEDWIGCSSASNSIQVVVDPLPVAAFSPNLSMFDISFNNLSYDATNYEWNFGDGATSADFEPTHSYSTSGVVDMYLVAFNNCGSDTAFLTLGSVGVEEQLEQTSINVYPNPSNGDFFVDMHPEVRGSARVYILNNLGQIVLNQLLVSKVSLIRTEKLPEGVYTLNVSTDEGFRTSRLIICK